MLRAVWHSCRMGGLQPSFEHTGRRTKMLQEAVQALVARITQATVGRNNESDTETGRGGGDRG